RHFSGDSDACRRTPSLMMLAARKSMFSGALNPDAVCCGAAAGSGGRVVAGCWAGAALIVARIVMITAMILVEDCSIAVPRKLVGQAPTCPTSFHRLR